MRSMLLALGAALLWQIAPLEHPQMKDFRYVRAVTVQVPGGDKVRGSKQVPAVCAVLDADVYAHSQALRDMRLFTSAATLVPYALSSSGTATENNEDAQILNQGIRAGHVVFDLRMPARPYTSVNLTLSAANYIATAKVSGSKDSNDTQGTALGSSTLFDLAAQKLGSNGTLTLPEVSFAYLHVDLVVSGVAGAPAPRLTVVSASIPPSREAQTLYTMVAQTTDIQQRGRNSVATVTLPARVPVERVRFLLDPADPSNFSRSVSLSAMPQNSEQGQTPQIAETIDGAISRVHYRQGEQEIRQQVLSFPATIGANAQHDAKVEVQIQNGDDKPVAVRAVLLEMRQRELCFDGPGSDSTDWPLQLAYGNDAVEAPVFDYARLFQPGQPARVGLLAAEARNPAFVATVEQKSLVERHPALLWAALLAMVAVLGLVAFRNAKKV